MSYKERLNNFNKSRKYMKEVDFLRGLIHHSRSRLLDYGCGTGFTAKIMDLWGFQIDGYDVEHYAGFKYKDPDGTYDVIYFMHSLAHIEQPEDVLVGLKQHLKNDGRIVVITPNKDWLDAINSRPGYKPDNTVIEHFCQYKLEMLFKEAGFNITMQGQFGERKAGQNERLFLVATL
jgi:SAM-dependent methyltransferase